MINDFFNREIEPGIVLLYPKRKDRGFCLALCLEVKEDDVLALKLKKDNTFRKVHLNPANSINWARVAWSTLENDDRFDALVNEAEKYLPRG